MTERSGEWMVEAEGLTKCYRMGERRIEVLRGVGLRVRRGEFLCVRGGSGSGKTTLFNLIGGLDIPDAGSVRLGGVDLEDLGPGRLAELRGRTVGYIFQTFNLLPFATALENVMTPLLFAGESVGAARRRAVEVLERVGLGERLEHRALQLSGGQQQRVACARALANGPGLLLADEPTGNLDGETGGDLIGLLLELRREAGLTVLAATHDGKLLEAADRRLELAEGCLRELDAAGGVVSS